MFDANVQTITYFHECNFCVVTFLNHLLVLQILCDFLKNFMEVPSRTIENVHALVPQYLKESDAYKA